MRGANLRIGLATPVLLLTTTWVAAGEIIYARADTAGANTVRPVIVSARAPKDLYDLGEQIPLAVAVLNFSAEPVYVHVDQQGLLNLPITVKDTDGAIITGDPAPTPPAPPQYYYAEINGEVVFTVPVKKIEPGQTATAVIADALQGYHGHLQEGKYYLTPADMPVIHDVGLAIVRDDVPHRLWIDPSTIISQATYKVNTVEVQLRRKTIIYVDAGASGANDGSSWANAHNYLQDALANANSSAKPAEIRVAQGIHTPDQGANQTRGDREATFQLTNNVTVKAGYAGLGGCDPDARDIQLHATILSGDLLGDDPATGSPDLLADPWRADNSYHVLDAGNTSRTAVLDGFLVTGGNANHAAVHNTGGGLCSRAGNATLFDCTFRGNSALVGGAVGCWDAGPIFISCSFVGNQAEVIGGAVACLAVAGESRPVLNNCRFHGNSSALGGAICNWHATPTLVGCEFDDNLASEFGGAFLAVGSHRQCDSTLSGCVFRANEAQLAGGALYSTGHGPDCRIKLDGCTFSLNKAGRGGAWGNDNTTFTSTHCLFKGNSARGDGGAIANDAGSGELTKCTFGENTAENGGAISNQNRSCPTVVFCTFTANSAADTGGAIANLDSAATLTQCRFIENKADNGGAVSNENASDSAVAACTFNANEAPLGAGMYNHKSGPKLTSCTFSDNHSDSGAGMANDNAGPILRNCLFVANLAQGEGGGMKNLDASNPVLTQCIFENNSAYQGGAIHNTQSAPQLGGCTFQGNEAIDMESATGGAIHNDGSDSTLTDCSFIENRASGGQGAISGYIARGGAIFNLAGSHPIRNCTFYRNVAVTIGSKVTEGGAIYSQDAAVRIGNCSLVENSADHGGAIFLQGSGTPVLTECTFRRNTAAQGAGLRDETYGSEAPATLAYCTFEHNAADFGGGTHIYTDVKTKMAYCLFQQNTARYQGGAMYTYGSPCLVGCTLRGNSADSGGAIENNRGSPALTNCVFSNNRSENLGAGMSNLGGTPRLDNCLFCGNEAELVGGGMLNIGLEGKCKSIRVWTGTRWETITECVEPLYCQPILNSCTFVGNYASSDGPIGNRGLATPTLTNCIIWGNAPVRMTGSAIVSYSDIQGGWAGQGNISTDPLFVSAGGWDPNGTPATVHDDFWVDGDYRLTESSPCIDTGEPGPIARGSRLDLQGAPRALGGGTDMGAYEHIPEGLADLNGDGMVDLRDFAVVAQNWRCAGPNSNDCRDGDISGDSEANFEDLQIVVITWLQEGNRQ